MRRISTYFFALFLILLVGFFLILTLSPREDTPPKSLAALLNFENWFKVSLSEPETILLMGKQGDNVDTLMLARVYPDIQQARLVSIPRDLYVDGLKINAYAFSRSLDSQIQVVERVSGMHVDHFVLVDLEAFRSIIDLLGGVDVTLDKDLVDPSYTVCEESGACSTLNYPAGTYHLNGTEALRIARSRHTTSDYDRAERQQKIVTAMKVKLDALQAGDFVVVMKLLETALSSVTTDLSFKEVAERAYSYRDVKVDSRGVLSTANVLASVPVPVDYITSFQQEVCEESEGLSKCHSQYFLYTLMPIDGDWSKISSWVRAALAK